jgi:flagellar biosynthesis protein FlhF
MKIRKFIVSNLTEAKSKIRAELGENAVLLSSRTIILPNTHEERLEIVAGLDEVPIKPYSEPQKSVSKPQTSTAQPLTPNSHLNILAEISGLKDTISQLSEAVKYKHSNSLSPVFSDLYKLLMDEEFTEDEALKVVGKLSSMYNHVNIESIIGKTKQLILENIRFVDHLSNLKSPTTAIFLGATGCGKTTSLIKLAVVAKLVHNYKVLIISTDTYKVSGAEQLQTFASLANIPFLTAYSPDELSSILKKETNFDLILIDTTGRSPNNNEHLEQINSFVKASNPGIRFLVVNANSSMRSLKLIIEKFRIL